MVEGNVKVKSSFFKHINVSPSLRSKVSLFKSPAAGNDRNPEPYMAKLRNKIHRESLNHRPRRVEGSLFRSAPYVVDGYVLPQHQVATRLIGLYWTHIYPIYPFLLREEFEESWSEVYLRSVQPDRLLLCTMFLVFALCIQLLDHVDEREAASAAYFNRAKDLLQLDIGDTGSAELVRCLVLMTQYLHSTSSAHQCWNVSGLAIRTAMNLRFHLPEASEDNQKLWHNCILMDRYVVRRDVLANRQNDLHRLWPAAHDHAGRVGVRAIASTSSRPERRLPSQVAAAV